MDFKKSVENVQRVQMHLQQLDVLIYSCENGDFKKHVNVCHMCNIFIGSIYICKSLFFFANTLMVVWCWHMLILGSSSLKYQLFSPVAQLSKKNSFFYPV